MKRLVLILALLLASLSGALAHSRHAEPPVQTSLDFPKTDPKTVGLIYQMLKVTDLLLTKHEIPYWIGFGTALGTVRHGGMIPWDDDADLVFFMKDEAKILALADEFARYGFYLEKQEIIRLIPSKDIRYPFIDLAGFSMWQDHTLRFDLASSRIYYLKFYWLPEEIEPLTRVKFGPIELSAPNQMIPYLLRAYGEDCLTMAVHKQPHQPSASKKKISAQKVPVVDFRPAEYEIVRTDIPLEYTQRD